jgi:hypothetical protein
MKSVSKLPLARALPRALLALLGLAALGLVGCQQDAGQGPSGGGSSLAAFSFSGNQPVAQDARSAFSAAVSGGYITPDCKPKLAPGMAAAFSIGYGAGSDTSDASVEAGVGYGDIITDALNRLVYRQTGSDGGNAAIPPGGGMDGPTRWGIANDFFSACQVAFSIRRDNRQDYAQVQASIGAVQGQLGNVQTNIPDAFVVKASDGQMATATFVFQKGFGLIGWDYRVQSTVGGTARVMISPNGGGGGSMSGDGGLGWGLADR